MELDRSEGSQEKYKKLTTLQDKTGEDHGNSIFASDGVKSKSEKEYAKNHRKALKMLKLKRWSESIAAFTRALNIRPDCESLFMYRAVAFMRLKKYEDAAADCTEAIALKPDLTRAYIRRAKCRKLQGDYLSAALDLVKVMKLQREFELPMSVVRSEYDDLIFQVIRDLDRDINSGFFDKYEQLSRKEEYFGDCFLKEQCWSEAIVKLTNAIKMYFGNKSYRLKDLFHRRGDCWKNLGYNKYHLAEADYTEAISLDDRNYSLYSKRSLIRSELGNSLGALEDLARMVVLNPNHVFSGNIKRYLDISARIQRSKSDFEENEKAYMQERLTKRQQNLGSMN